MSPTVPPTSVMTTSRSSPVRRVMRRLISSVMCGDDLHGLAEVVAAALGGEHRRVDRPGRGVRVPGEALVDVPLVVAESRSVSPPSSVTNTSPCSNGFIVPGRR